MHRRLLSLSLSLLVLAAASPAEARRASPSGLVAIGYRVVVTPEIAERAPGVLFTRALRWQLRSVWATPQGIEVLAQPMPPRGRSAKSLADARVIVERPWEHEDYTRESETFASLDKALRRFDGLKQSSDLTLVGQPELPPAPVIVVTQPPLPPEPVPMPEPVPVRTCEQVLLDQGHHPMHLDNCKGAELMCATVLLEAGHHPMHLDECQGVDPTCAVALLQAGHHPQQLDECK